MEKIKVVKPLAERGLTPGVDPSAVLTKPTIEDLGLSKQVSKKKTYIKPEAETVGFEVFQLGKDGDQKFNIRDIITLNKAEFTNTDALSCQLLRPLALIYQRKVNIENSLKKIGGKRLKAPIPFSLTAPLYFKVSIGKNFFDTSALPTGVSSYISTFASKIKLSGDLPFQQAQAFLVEVLNVLTSSAKYTTIAQHQQLFKQVDQAKVASQLKLSATSVSLKGIKSPDKKLSTKKPVTKTVTRFIAKKKEVEA